MGYVAWLKQQSKMTGRMRYVPIEKQVVTEEKRREREYLPLTEIESIVAMIFGRGEQANPAGYELESPSRRGKSPTSPHGYKRE